MDAVVHRRRHWPWWLAAVWLMVAACLSMPSAGRVEPSFPHRVHVVDNRLACGFCHGGALVGERPGMPPPELCAPCHDQFDPQKPVERRIAAFYDGGRYHTLVESGLGEDVRFSHARHVTGAKLACDECHGGIEHETEVPLGPLAKKADCMGCHERRGLANLCQDCHTEIDRSWHPPTHRGDWVHRHGTAASAVEPSSVDRCQLCHLDAQGCLACHQQMPPRDHNQTFRVRTHGLQASIDRSRCLVCHTQDSCVQCHATTRPRSHRAGFGSPGQHHCGSCHFPLADNDCAVCHEGAPSHDLAAPLPGDHLPSMNCRLCHGNGVRLPHPDGGHPCTICHR